MADIHTIKPDVLAKKQQDKEVHLIDVRTPAEFREVHASIAVNIPLDQLTAEQIKDRVNGNGADPVYLICQSGNRSSKACQKLIDAGFVNVISVEGGTKAWEAEGLPVNRGKKTISLERQVRIAAGFLVLTGALLGMFVNPWFSGLSAFVGAGLMFAGITDTCGMAMILAKMPWNRA
ncbi:rhodanese-like domain-containing protein [Gimesia maris]|uniref:rhodanese-like domain-containing protein n=1 Tax=Gimesia maris TaxID=122 RepID=UPI00241D87BD|nr:rhodanese-like domain-containing protein [Gimesia maris]|tara:strand:- start:77535 stop:78065 length:531 start_codon:yes stop_codon:yes gene_type:complete